MAVLGGQRKLWGSNSAAPQSQSLHASSRAERKSKADVPTPALAAALTSCLLHLLSTRGSFAGPLALAGTLTGAAHWGYPECRAKSPSGHRPGVKGKGRKRATGRGLGGRKSRQDGQRSQTKPVTKTHVFTVRPRPGCRPETPLPLTPMGLLLTGTASTEVTRNGSCSATPAMVGGNPVSGWGAGDSCSAPRTQLPAVPSRGRGGGGHRRGTDPGWARVLRIHQRRQCVGAATDMQESRVGQPMREGAGAWLGPYSQGPQAPVALGSQRGSSAGKNTGTECFW